MYVFVKRGEASKQRSRTAHVFVVNCLVHRDDGRILALQAAKS